MRCGTECSDVEIPDMPAGVIRKAVAKPHAKHIFARAERDLIRIVIHKVIGIVDVRRKTTLCDAFAI